MQEAPDEPTLASPADDREWPRSPLTVADVDRAARAYARRLKREAPIAPAPVLAPPSAQLVLPTHGGQLGLDGRTYAPVESRSDLPSGEAARGPLGSSSEESPTTEPAKDFRRSKNHAAQLSLSVWTNSKQLDLWSRIRATTIVRFDEGGERIAQCHRTRVWKPDGETRSVTALRSARKAWNVIGTVTCDSYNCPACGPKRAREATARISLVIDRHRSEFPDGDLGLLSLTVPHVIEDSTASVIKLLYATRVRFWRSKEWKAFASEYGIENRITALDAVHGGANGSHPHFHALIPLARLGSMRALDDVRARVAVHNRRTPTFNRALIAERAAENEQRKLEALELMIELAAAERVPDELVRVQDASTEGRRWYFAQLVRQWRLVDAWERAVLDCHGEIENIWQFRNHALQLEPGEKADAYLLKWGLAKELGMSPAKDRSHLRLLDVTRAGDAAELSPSGRRNCDVAADLYRAWVVATKSRQWVTGLGDACKRYGITDEDVKAHLDEVHRKIEEENPSPKVREVVVVIHEHLWTTFLQIGHAEMFAWLDEQAELYGDAILQTELDAFLTRHKQQTEREREGPISDRRDARAWSAER